MKRTTYIIMGTLVAGLAAVCGAIFHISSHSIAREDAFMEIGGSQKTVQLPACKVVKLTQSPALWKESKRGVLKAEYVISFGEAALEVSSTDSQQGSFSFAGDMESFMSTTSIGDTLLITFDFPKDKIEERLQSVGWIKLRSKGMGLD